MGSQLRTTLAIAPLNVLRIYMDMCSIALQALAVNCHLWHLPLGPGCLWKTQGCCCVVREVTKCFLANLELAGLQPCQSKFREEALVELRYAKVHLVHSVGGMTVLEHNFEVPIQRLAAARPTRHPLQQIGLARYWWNALPCCPRLLNDALKHAMSQTASSLSMTLLLQKDSSEQMPGKSRTESQP